MSVSTPTPESSRVGPPTVDRLAERLLRALARRTLTGTLEVDGPWGSWSEGAGAPVVRVAVHNPRAYRSLLGHASVGLGQSYVKGWWDCDGLTTFVRLLLRATSGGMARIDRLAATVSGPLSLLRRRGAPTPALDGEHVADHYDRPPELFNAMLDDTLTYSCGIYERETASLEEAQVAKLGRVCRKLDLGPQDHLLEIGTGWGALAMHAAERFGCRVTTTTVSRSQFEVATERVRQAGLADRVEVLFSDYRDLTGHYDKLVSVEMIEAVDWRLHDTFFGACNRLLRPDGVMVLQAIVMADQSYERAKFRPDFVRSMVFPGSCIPSIAAICGSLSRATSLRVFDLEDIGRHYAPTLRDWRERLFKATAESPDLVDTATLRLWNLYLSYCEAAFLERQISDVQMVIVGPSFRPSLSLREP